MALTDITVIHPGTAQSPAAVMSGSVAGDHDLLVSGRDALALWDVAIAQADVVLAAWSDPELPVVVYDDDPDSLEQRLRTGTVVLVSGGVGIDPLARHAAPAAARVWFGDDALQVRLDPSTAASRIAGGGADLALSGATVAIFASVGSGLANHLAQLSVGTEACLTVRDETALARSDLLRRAAFSHQLGSFQYRVDDDAGQVTGATILGGAAAQDRAAELFGGGAPFDLVVADSGRPLGALGDITALAVDGEVTVTLADGLARPTVVLRGGPARTARARLHDDDDHEVVGGVPGEDRHRYLAHQWVGAMRRAADAKTGYSTPGGPTMASEARAVGLAAPEATGPGVDGSVVARVAAARGWHVIAPDLAPVLDPVLDAARRQAAGDDAPIPADQLAAVRALGERPGFWTDLLSATRPHRDGVVLFPYPAPAVEMLRAAVAAGGDAEELRRLLGPVKVAVYRAFAGGEA